MILLKHKNNCSALYGTYVHQAKDILVMSVLVSC